MVKRTILILVPHYLPGYKNGGPVKSIFNMIENLKNDFNFKIITKNSDLGEKHKYKDIESDKWLKLYNCDIYYGSKKSLNINNLNKLLYQTKYDKIYFNSYFDFKFSILPIIYLKIKKFERNNIILAPRGEFNDGCLNIKKYKKYIYIYVAKLFKLYNNIYWHATNEEEKKYIYKYFKTDKIIVSNNLVKNIDHISLYEIKKKKDNELEICFISRITREKNLLYALNIIKNIRKNIIFDIYGTNHEDQKYWQECNKKIIDINKSNKYIKVNYKGSLMPENVSETFSKYDLFFFPTVGENFGHVIFESISVGTPVLISNKTPWNDIKNKNIGWVFDLKNINGIINTIEELITMKEEEYSYIRRKNIEYAIEYSKNNDDIENIKKLFNIKTKAI